jgi:hypothetical protein
VAPPPSRTAATNSQQYGRLRSEHERIESAIREHLQWEKAAASGSKENMELLLSTHPDIRITEPILMMPGPSKLSRRDEDIFQRNHITPEVTRAKGRFQLRSKDAEPILMPGPSKLPRRDEDIFQRNHITPEVTRAKGRFQLRFKDDELQEAAAKTVSKGDVTSPKAPHEKAREPWDDPEPYPVLGAGEDLQLGPLRMLTAAGEDAHADFHELLSFDVSSHAGDESFSNASDLLKHSYSESVYTSDTIDTGDTSMWVHKSGQAALKEEAIQAIAATLANSSLRPLLIQAFNNVKEETVLQQLVHLMPRYSRDLQLEASTEMEKLACSFIGANSARIAFALSPHVLAKQKPVVSQANLERLAAEPWSATEKVNLLGKPHQPGLEDDMELEDDENIGAMVLKDAKRFLIEADAFQKLCHAVRDFSASTEETGFHVIAPSMPLILRKASAPGIAMQAGPDAKPEPPTINQLEAVESPTLQAVDVEPEEHPAISQLEPVESPTVQSLEAEERALQGLLNMFQIWLEDTFRTELGWWPLPSPRRRLSCPTGFTKIWWRCVCVL